MNEDNLEKMGWTKRNIVEEPRLSELAEFYKELGFEVFLQDSELEAVSDDTCNACLNESHGKYKVIYTRHQIENNK